MPTTCCVRGCRSRGSGKDTKIKYFRFPKDEDRRLMWIKAIRRPDFVPTNNTMICNAHFTAEDYQNRPDLIKLTNRAIPSVFNCVENAKRSVNRNKMVIHCSGLKHSEKEVRKCYDNLSDHTYVLKLPKSPEKISPESMDKSFDPSTCMIQTLEVIENSMVEPRALDLSKSNNSSVTDIKNPYFQVTKDHMEHTGKNWRKIAIIQTNTIRDLRKKVKVLQQKIRRHTTKIETLKNQLEFPYLQL